jgi:hypothetical protein
VNTEQAETVKRRIENRAFNCGKARLLRQKDFKRAGTARNQ